jgi:MFS family permease
MTATAPGDSMRAITFRLVGLLFLVELTSGIIQGYYVPLISDIVRYLHIHDADYNWFEAAQLLVSALTVPVLAKLGDMVGHKRMLLVSTALTALATWGLVLTHEFWGYLIAFALAGFYTVWLPLEVALIFDRGRRSSTGASQTRRAAGYLVVALEAGAIAGALGGSAVFAAVGGSVPLTLIAPAVCVTLVFFVILFGVPESDPVPGRTLDLGGFLLLSLGLLLITGGLTFLRVNGPGTWWVWVLIAAGVLSFIPFGRFELTRSDPAIDLRMLKQPSMWPVQLAAGLFGISVLGAQTPLSTFAGTDPRNGYGLGMSSGQRSILIGVYLVSLIVGAVLFPLLSRRATPRIALIVAAFLVAGGYLALIPFHADALEVIVCLVIAGVGSGALVAALPAAAAAAAPRGQTGIAAGLTNTTKTIGGSFASSVFGIVLVAGAAGTAATAATAGTAGTAASLAGYIAVWAICGGGALVAALALFVVPRLAFADVGPEGVAAAAGREE